LVAIRILSKYQVLFALINARLTLNIFLEFVLNIYQKNLNIIN